MITSLLSDPINTIIALLLSLPGLLLALCGHEASHGLAAYLCGDPTAKYQGRLTLNPLKHLDPTGFVCLMLFRFGWAKPVPVNPRNFRNPRRDDLIVSLAGITANILMFIIGCFIMYIPLTVLLRQYHMTGMDCQRYYQAAFAFSDLYLEAFGQIPHYLFEMLFSFTTINLSLAMFNLLPIPPLDGYHVLNDLILHNRDLFAAQRVARIGQIVLLAILFVPQLSQLYSGALTTVMTYAFRGVGFVGYHLIHLVGLI